MCVMKRYARAVGLISVVVGMCWIVSANATTLSISPDPLVGSPGASVLTSVRYRAQGPPVAALQFDLLYDPSVLSITTATAGSGATAASKTLSKNLISPGDLRVIIAGSNQNVLGDGSVADLTVQVSNSAPKKGHHQLFLCNVIASDPNGLSVPIKATGVDSDLNDKHNGKDKDRDLRKMCNLGRTR